MRIPTLRCSREDLDAAVAEALARHADVLYPFDGPSGLSADERAALEEGGVCLDEPPDDAADPVRQGIALYTAILASALTTAEAARHLGVSEMRVRQRLTRRSLFGLQTAHGWRVPSFQFTTVGELPGWDRVAPALPADISPIEVLRWLDQPNPALRDGRRRLSPRDWLCSGHAVAAVEHAAADLHVL